MLDHSWLFSCRFPLLNIPEFSYEVGGKRHLVTVQRDPEQHIVLLGDLDRIPVSCVLDKQMDGAAASEDSGATNYHFDVMVQPTWSPRGASRFLDLVRRKYYDGAALNRAVPQFLIQFGIARDYEERRHWDTRTILDDAKWGGQFQGGYLSFAGELKHRFK